jgi:hypothetical protein
MKRRKALNIGSFGEKSGLPWMLFYKDTTDVRSAIFPIA